MDEGLFKKSLLGGYSKNDVEQFVRSRDQEMNKLKGEVNSLRKDLEGAVERLTARATARIEKEMTKATTSAEKILQAAEEQAVRKEQDADRVAMDIKRDAEQQASSVLRTSEHVIELRDNMLREMREFIVQAIDQLDSKRAA